MNTLKKLLATALVAVFAACTVTEVYTLPDGTVVTRTCKFETSNIVETKPAGVVLRTSKVTFEDGSTREAEIIDTDGDGEGDHM